jgi:hypothetical protein
MSWLRPLPENWKEFPVGEMVPYRSIRSCFPS